MVKRKNRKISQTFFYHICLKTRIKTRNYQWKTREIFIWLKWNKIWSRNNAGCKWTRIAGFSFVCYFSHWLYYLFLPGSKTNLSNHFFHLVICNYFSKYFQNLVKLLKFTKLLALAHEFLSSHYTNWPPRENKASISSR